MRNIINALHNYFIDSELRKDENQFRKARIFINTTLITSAFAFFFLINTFLFDMPYHKWSMIVCTIWFLLLAFLLRWKILLITCVNLFALVALAATFWDGFFLGGLQSYDFMWMCLIPVLAMMIGNKKVGWFWLFITIISVTVMGILQLKGFHFISAINPKYYQIHGLNSLISLVVIIFAVVMVIENAFEVSLTQLDEKNKLLEIEKEKSDQLLLNILPADISLELKQTGKTKAYSYKIATVMFADFVNFTLLGEKLSPEELVLTIGAYFEAFDNIIEKHGIEKIKTVGDAYICAAGLPIATTDNAMIMINVAMDFIEAMENLSVKRSTLKQEVFEIRIGINTGPLVAGVVGIKKFAYDIWGDTVNTAARMQEKGAPNRINISGSTYELVKDKFDCEYRGKIQAKNKGEIDMYFIGKHHTSELVY